MKNNSLPRVTKFSWLLNILIILALVTGIFCRFYDMDRKALSNDETFSSTYIYGHQLTSVIDRKLVTARELQTYQIVNPEENLTESLKRLITKPYVFPPLYGILMQFWARFWSGFTNSPAIISRSLSVFLSLFSLGGMYWLYRELSDSKRMAWIATALVAVSPFHFQYSQIIRTYSLTTAWTLIASAALLRAIRVNQRSAWAVYGVSVAMGLYSNLLFGFLAIAHLIGILWLEKFKFSSIFRSYFLASFLGGVTFIPWFILFITSPGLLGYSVAQVNVESSPLSLIQVWVKNIKPIFIDVNNPWVEFTSIFSSLSKLAAPLVILLLIVACYYLIFYAPRKVRIFILSLIIGGGVILMIKDLVLGGTFSSRLRYLIPYVVGIELLIIYFLTSQLNQKKIWQKKFAETALSILLIGGILSCTIISLADSWVAFGSPEFPLAAKEINKSDRPIVIFEDYGDALTMSHLLDPQASFYLTRKVDYYLQEKSNHIYRDFSDIFLFKPGKKTQKKLAESSYLTMKLIQEPTSAKPKVPQVWRIQATQNR